MRESELQLRVKLLIALRSELENEPNDSHISDEVTWFDGIRYAMHLIREADLDERSA